MQSLLESKEFQEIFENDKELCLICENVFRDPLMIIPYLQNPKTAQKIKDLQDLDIFAKLPFEVWRFEHQSVDEARKQIPELAPILDDQEYIKTLIEVCNDPGLSEK